MARKSSEFLGKVEHGGSIQIPKHGCAGARFIPDSDFMNGKKAVDLFAAVARFPRPFLER